jgi:hypothetical protein
MDNKEYKRKLFKETVKKRESDYTSGKMANKDRESYRESHLVNKENFGLKVNKISKKEFAKKMASKKPKFTSGDYVNERKKEFKNYSGGKAAWNKEEKERMKFAPGGKYHKDTKD